MCEITTVYFLSSKYTKAKHVLYAVTSTFTMAVECPET